MGESEVMHGYSAAWELVPLTTFPCLTHPALLKGQLYFFISKLSFSKDIYKSCWDSRITFHDYLNPLTLVHSSSVYYNSKMKSLLETNMCHVVRQNIQSNIKTVWKNVYSSSTFLSVEFCWSSFSLLFLLLCLVRYF